MTILIITLSIITIWGCISPILAYRRGIRDGKLISQGKDIPPIVPALKSLKKTDTVKLDEKTQKQLDYINNYRG
jgi:hypothetical protein